MQRAERAARWVFTINNFTVEEEDLVRNLGNNPDVKYIIAEEEHLEEGTPHIQGYIHMKDRKRRNQIETLLGGRAFIEVARGSEEENVRYCSKEDQIIIEAGERSSRGRRPITTVKTNEDAAEIIKAMREMDEDEFEATYPKYYLTHKSLYNEFRHEHLVKMQKTWDGSLKQKNLWIWGRPGTGKSRVARTGLENWMIFSKPFNKWWNGYMPLTTKRVVIDDWPSKENGGNMLVQHLKIWGDRYPFTGETKGSHIAIAPSFQLIITSNYCIDDCFITEEDKEAIHRRFTEYEWRGTEGVLDPYMIIEADE